MTLADRLWLKKVLSDAEIGTKATPINVRGLGSTKHKSSEHAVVTMYMAGTALGNKKLRITKITREVHMADDLRANMLIGMDIIGPKRIDISVSIESASVGSCKTTILIHAKPRGNPVHHTVNAKGTIVVPPRSIVPIAVHHISVPNFRDFIFEPEKCPLSLYAHHVDGSMHSVMARNDTDLPIRLPRNYQLGYVTEFDFDHHHTDDSIADLAIRSPCTIQIKVPVTNKFAGKETKLPNGVTIYGNEHATQCLAAIVTSFPTCSMTYGL